MHGSEQKLSRSNPLPAFESKWLLGHLRENEWWLKACKARWVLKQLGKWLGQDSSNSVNDFKATLEQLHEGFVGAYFRDIFVWLPDVRWDSTMPACPECESSKCVVPHSWCYDSLARRVQLLDTHYFIMDRRYNCNSCHDKQVELRKAASCQSSWALVLSTQCNQRASSFV